MTRQIKVGLTILVSIVISFLVISWMKGWNIFSAAQKKYQVVFQSVNGLKTGDAVYVLGIRKGTVKNLEIKKGKVLVTLLIDEDVKLKSDASVRISMKELMGGKVIEINPGVSNEMLADGTIINGTSDMDVLEMSARMGQIFAKLDETKLNVLIDNLTKISSTAAELSTDENKKHINDLIKNLSESSQKLNALLGEAQQKNMVDKMDETLTNINDIAKNVTHTLMLTDSLLSDVNSLMPDTKKLLSSMEKTIQSADGVLSDMKTMLENMKSDETFAGKILNDSAFAKKMDETIDNLNQTLVYIREKKLHVHVSLSKKNK